MPCVLWSGRSPDNAEAAREPASGLTVKFITQMQLQFEGKVTRISAGRGCLAELARPLKTPDLLFQVGSPSAVPWPARRSFFKGAAASDLRQDESTLGPLSRYPSADRVSHGITKQSKTAACLRSPRTKGWNLRPTGDRETSRDAAARNWECGVNTVSPLRRPFRQRRCQQRFKNEAGRSSAETGQAPTSHLQTAPEPQLARMYFVALCLVSLYPLLLASLERGLLGLQRTEST